MINNKDLAFEKINENFEKLSNNVLKQLDSLRKNFESGTDNFNVETMEDLFKKEEKINKIEQKIDDLIIQTIALHHPMASEIRKLFAMYRMVINLERIGDLCIKVANIVSEIKDKELLTSLSPTIHGMISITSEMVNKALLSFTANDAEFAMWTIKEDHVLDDLNKKILKSLIHNENIPAEIRKELISFTDFRSVISSIERMGDHATNIAETTIYSILGESIRHKNFNEEDI